MYRFAGVKQSATAKVKTAECCEPVCGPTTCEPAVEVETEEEPKMASKTSG